MRDFNLYIRKNVFTPIALLISTLLLSQESKKGLDSTFDDWFKPISDAWSGFIFYSVEVAKGVEVPLVVIVLFLTGFLFTLIFKFPNIRYFITGVKVAKGHYDNIDHVTVAPMKGDVTPGGDSIETIRVEGAIGEVSHFQAFTAALSATVGLGNIAGVAIALSLGGPGATLWMILAGLVGMSSKFVECTLGVKYRDVEKDGTIYGGPMYYLSKGLKEFKLEKLGKILAVFFAIMCVGGSLGAGNMFQANQAAKQFNSIVHLESASAGAVFGLFLSILVGIVIIGGVKRIGKIAERIVPFMIGIYFLAAIVILILNFDKIGFAFSQIIDGAFNPEGIAGGVIGVMFIGFQRAVFSNEAGVGSASIAHSAVKTRFPASEGLVALLGPFIDTVVVCTITALVIILTNTDGTVMQYGVKEIDGVLATSRAFAKVLPWFPYVLTVAVFMFAFSTMLSWSYYGLQSWMYVFGRSKKSDYTFKIIFCLMIILGAAIELDSVINFSDAMIFAMAIPNIIGLFILFPKVKEEVRKYIKAITEKEED
ncbi:MAG: alanine:cation symporter family protein [Flavobacteriales bacterium]|nr:alanine:cation symporter family protein [Flavobacteriales bacterium]